MGTQQFTEAEQALQVAVAQSPRNLTAHELLGRLYRQHLNRPDEAFAHEGRALSLHNELAARRRSEAPAVSGSRSIQSPGGGSFPRPSSTVETSRNFPAPFSSEVDPRQIITVVSGLPRTGTSLMMQLLVAAGREALTDAQRAADEDNPRGYFEFERTLSLAQDNAWLPHRHEAR